MCINSTTQPSNGQQPSHSACIGSPQACAYEKAIDAYQFIVLRYHTWMNYYSVFVGAFFVALQSTWSDNLVGLCNSNGLSDQRAYFFPLLIAILGWGTSVCWLASLIGHSTWMNSYISILKKLEQKYLPEDLYVYSYIREKDWAEMHENPCRKEIYARGYISTQKVTQWFVIVVLYCWQLVIAFLLKGCINWLYLFFGALAVVFIWVVLHYCCCKLFSDVLNGMKKQN